jgi:cytochrome b
MKQPVWDLPVRLFHWTLAALIAFSWWSAEEGHLDWHLYSGLGILSLLIFRILWGFFGSSTARFANFVRGPAGVRAYLKNPSSWRVAGHTPLGALSVLALLGAVGAQALMGLFSSDEDGLFEGPLAKFVSIDQSEVVSEIHHAFFNVIIALVLLHVGAIIYYRIRGKPLVGAMITGKGQLPEGAAPMRSGRWWVALLCLIAGVALTRWLIAGLPPFFS